MLWVRKRTGSFEHPKHMLKLINKKIIAILRKNYLLNWPYVLQAPFCIRFVSGFTSPFKTQVYDSTFSKWDRLMILLDYIYQKEFA